MQCDGNHEWCAICSFNNSQIAHRVCPSSDKATEKTYQDTQAQSREWPRTYLSISKPRIFDKHFSSSPLLPGFLSTSQSITGEWGGLVWLFRSALLLPLKGATSTFPNFIRSEAILEGRTPNPRTATRFKLVLFTGADHLDPLLSAGFHLFDIFKKVPALGT